jgi:hypothetical protein
MLDELDDSAVLDTKDVARIFKIPRQTQIDLRANGHFIPHFFAGRRVFYRKDAAVRWIKEQELKARADQEAKAAASGGPSLGLRAPLTLGDATLTATLAKIIRTEPSSEQVRIRVAELLGGGANED